MSVKSLFKLFLVKILLALASVQIALAQSQQLELLAPLPNQGKFITFGPGCYIKQIYQFGLGIAGALAVLMVVWGAVEYSISGAVDKKAEAKDRIRQAIFGLVLLLATVLILSTINPNLTQFQDIVPRLCPEGQTCPPPPQTCP